MKSITIENMPDELHAYLTAQAAEHGRALTDEVVCLLEAAVESDIPNPRTDPKGFEAYLDRHAIQSKGEPFTAERLQASIDEGHE